MNQIELAKQVSKAFGYSVLSRHHEKAEQASRIDSVLAELNIAPFSPDYVESYKKNKRKEEWKKMSYWQRRKVDTIFDYDGNSCRLFQFTPSHRFQWYRCNLKDYPFPIPESVLALALKINSTFPFTRLDVEYLGHRNYDQEARLAADPFLRVHYGDEVRYIAVWEENSFDTLKA